MASTAAPNGVVPSLLSSGWLTADTTGQQSSGRVPVTSDNDSTIPNPQVPIQDGVIDLDIEGLNAGGIGEPWEPTTNFPWPATPASGTALLLSCRE